MHEGQYPLNGDKIDTPVGELKVGSVIQLSENGSPVDYIIVHQGLPSEMYDESCNGTWVVRQTIAENRVWDSNNNDYKNSDIHTSLNGEFLSSFYEETQSGIKQVKIPSEDGEGSTSQVSSGANGLSCKAFLLSGYEVGFTSSSNQNLRKDGTALSYFNDDTSRVAMNGAEAYEWWTRSPITTSGAFYVRTTGKIGSAGFELAKGFRPAFILDPTFTVQAYPTANFVVGMKNSLMEIGVMNSTATSVGSWDKCERRAWCGDTFEKAIPSTLLPIFKNMNVITADTAGSQTPLTSVDKFALFAEKEIIGTNIQADGTAEAALFQMDWYKISANIKKTLGERDAPGGYFTRSACKGHAGAFSSVDRYGSTDTQQNGANNPSGISCFGCI